MFPSKEAYPRKPPSGNLPLVEPDRRRPRSTDSSTPERGTSVLTALAASLRAASANASHPRFPSAPAIPRSSRSHCTRSWAESPRSSPRFRAVESQGSENSMRMLVGKAGNSVRRTHCAMDPSNTWSIRTSNGTLRPRAWRPACAASMTPRRMSASLRSARRPSVTKLPRNRVRPFCSGSIESNQRINGGGWSRFCASERGRQSPRAAQMPGRRQPSPSPFPPSVGIGQGCSPASRPAQTDRQTPESSAPRNDVAGVAPASSRCGNFPFSKNSTAYIASGSSNGDVPGS